MQYDEIVIITIITSR